MITQIVRQEMSFTVPFAVGWGGNNATCGCVAHRIYGGEMQSNLTCTECGCVLPWIAEWPTLKG